MRGKTTLRFLLHGFSGHGKSWIGGTCPPPVLVIDLEGRGHYLPHDNIIDWDGKSTPPEADGSWTHCVVTVSKYGQLDMIRQWLESGQHQFRSVVLDSLTEAQKRFIDDLAGTNILKDYDWGTVLRNLEGLVRDLRDCTLMESNPIEVVCIITGTKVMESGRKVPLLQGQLRDNLSYLLDSVGYVYAANDQDGLLQRYMVVQPIDPNVDAKDGTNSLGGPILTNPNFTDIWSRIREERNS